MFIAKVEINDAKLNEIFERLEKAKEEIYNCYNELQNLQIVNIVKEETANAEQ